MLKSLAAKIVLIHLCCLSLLALLVMTTVLTVGAQEEKQLVLRLSERQSMLSQRITQQLLGYAAKADGGEDHKFQRVAVLSSMQMFEKTEHALNEGGLVRLDLRMLNLGEVPPATDAVREQLRRTHEVYELFRIRARNILDGDVDARRQGVEYIIKHNSELLQELNSSAVLVKADLDLQIARVRSIQTTALLIGFLVISGLLFAARKWIYLPFAELSRASDSMSRGEIAEPISIDGPEEIHRIGASFERLRVSLKNFLATPESETSL